MKIKQIEFVYGTTSEVLEDKYIEDYEFNIDEGKIEEGVIVVLNQYIKEKEAILTRSDLQEIRLSMEDGTVYTVNYGSRALNNYWKVLVNRRGDCILLFVNRDGFNFDEFVPRINLANTLVLDKEFRYVKLGLKLKDFKVV